MTTNRRKTTRLSQTDNFALIAWLKARTFTPDDSIASLVEVAKVELNNPSINYNHIQARMQEFELSIPDPEKVDPVTLKKRVEWLESQVKTLQTRLQLLESARYGIGGGGGGYLGGSSLDHRDQGT